MYADIALIHYFTFKIKKPNHIVRKIICIKFVDVLLKYFFTGEVFKIWNSFFFQLKIFRKNGFFCLMRALVN